METQRRYIGHFCNLSMYVNYVSFTIIGIGILIKSAFFAIVLASLLSLI